ncbi:hypothetical protein Tco_1246639 [Tanacetum coccineum]
MVVQEADNRGYFYYRGRNPVFHSKTKHIEIRHHFIRDAYEKKLIQVLKIHTDDNVGDLLTKDFDVSRNLVLLAQKLLLLGLVSAAQRCFRMVLLLGLVNDRAVVISELSVRNDLLFDDEDSITCLTNDEIFENLALMGYEQLSTKLTFQKGSFSPQWKFLIHTILHCISSKSTAWNEFSTNLASAVICLAKGQKFNFSKLIFDGMLRNLDPKKFLMYPRFLQLFLNNQLKDLPEPFNDTYETPCHTKKVFTNMARKGVKFSGKVTPLFDSMLVPHQAPEGEGSEQPTEPQPTPSPTHPSTGDQPPVTDSSSSHDTTQDSRDSLEDTNGSEGTQGVTMWERAITTDASLVATQESDNIIRTQTTAMPNVDIPQGMDTGGSLRRQKNMGGLLCSDRLRECLTSNEHSLRVTILEVREDRIETYFELMDIVHLAPQDSLLLGGYTPRSDEGRLKLEELMVMCIKLSKHVLDLEKEKDAQAVESSNDDLDEEDASKQGRTKKDAENQGKIGADDTEAVNTTGEGVSTAAPRPHPITTPVLIMRMLL